MGDQSLVGGRRDAGAREGWGEVPLGCQVHGERPRARRARGHGLRSAGSVLVRNIEHNGKEKYTHDFTVHGESGKTIVERTITFDVPGVRGLGIRLVVPFASKKFDEQAGEKLNAIFSGTAS